jgi:hypothetical protein
VDFKLGHYPALVVFAETGWQTIRSKEFQELLTERAPKREFVKHPILFDNVHAPGKNTFHECVNAL